MSIPTSKCIPARADRARWLIRRRRRAGGTWSGGSRWRARWCNYYVPEYEQHCNIGQSRTCRAIVGPNAHSLRDVTRLRCLLTDNTYISRGHRNCKYPHERLPSWKSYTAITAAVETSLHRLVNMNHHLRIWLQESAPTMPGCLLHRSTPTLMRTKACVWHGCSLGHPHVAGQGSHSPDSCACENP